ncbi:hypothetical protein R8Z50_23950 [Longispora sp. K20-0274]|uniref:hypothetical protein n=1 Tax=Longispora sp. K20-0274 TaxID=3088255 RepID=UPI0039998C02
MRAQWKPAVVLLLTPLIGMVVLAATSVTTEWAVRGDDLWGESASWSVAETVNSVVVAVVLALFGLLVGRWRPALAPWAVVSLLGAEAVVLLIAVAVRETDRGQYSWQLLVGAALWTVVMGAVALAATRLDRRTAGAVVLVGGVLAYYFGVAVNVALHPNMHLSPELSATRFPLTILTSTPYGGDGLGVGLVSTVSGGLPQLLLIASAFAVAYLTASRGARRPVAATDPGLGSGEHREPQPQY